MTPSKDAPRSFWVERPLLLGSAAIVAVLVIFGFLHPGALGSFKFIALGALPSWLFACVVAVVARRAAAKAGPPGD